MVGPLEKCHQLVASPGIVIDYQEMQRLHV
jgi:hypothetical protein